MVYRKGRILIGFLSFFVLTIVIVQACQVGIDGYWLDPDCLFTSEKYTSLNGRNFVSQYADYFSKQCSVACRVYAPSYFPDLYDIAGVQQFCNKVNYVEVSCLEGEVCNFCWNDCNTCYSGVYDDDTGNCITSCNGMFVDSYVYCNNGLGSTTTESISVCESACDSSIDAACDNKMIGESCGDNKFCDDSCKCRLVCRGEGDSCTSTDDCCANLNLICDPDSSRCIKCNSEHKQTTSGTGFNLCDSDEELGRGSQCTASSICDEKAAFSGLSICNQYGASYFEDICSGSCGLLEDNSVCRSNSFSSTCTGSTVCEGKAPNSYFRGGPGNYFEIYCNSNCQYTWSCESNYGASTLCDEKQPGDSCGGTSVCDNNCQCGCNPGDTKTCEFCSGINTCSGTQTCRSDGTWESCTGSPCTNCEVNSCGATTTDCSPTPSGDADVDFYQSGLPAGTNWCVRIGSSSTRCVAINPLLTYIDWNDIPVGSSYQYQAVSGYSCTSGCSGVITSSGSKSATYTKITTPTCGTGTPTNVQTSSCTGSSYSLWPNCYLSSQSSQCSSDCGSGTTSILSPGYNCGVGCLYDPYQVYCYDCICTTSASGSVCGTTTCPLDCCSGYTYYNYPYSTTTSAGSCARTCSGTSCPACSTCSPSITPNSAACGYVCTPSWSTQYLGCGAGPCTSDNMYIRMFDTNGCIGDQYYCQSDASCCPWGSWLDRGCAVSCGTEGTCTEGYQCERRSNGCGSYEYRCVYDSSCPTCNSQGQSCSSSGDCCSGYCVDGVCCDSACAGTCQRCDSYDGTAGTCHNIAEGHDPNNECSSGQYDCDGTCRLRRRPGTCDGESATCENEDWQYQNCVSGTSCVAQTGEDYCSSTASCSIGGIECQNSCDQGQEEYRCNGFNSCSSFWRWTNVNACDPFSCSGTGCTDICETGCGAPACDGLRMGESCGTGRECDGNCNCVVASCSGYYTQSSCNGASGCSWCSGDSSCKVSSSILCQPGQCNGLTQYCTNSCTWSNCAGTDASCSCSSGSCQSCSATEECNSYSCQSTECVLNSVTITSNCGSVCEQGETISMSGSYSGDCSAADFFQIDAESIDGLCYIHYESSLSGIWDSTITVNGGSVSGSWTVPSITSSCSGKQVFPTLAALYTGAPGGGKLSIDTTGNTFGSFTFDTIESQVTISSSPELGSNYVILDGSPITTESSYSWLPGSTHTISAASTVSCGTGCRDVFDSWSDGGSQTHTITTPSSPITYTANYQRQYYLDMSLTPSSYGSVSPSDGWRDSGDVVLIRATPNGGYGFVGWSGYGTGSYSGSTNPYSLTISGAITETANFAVDECDSDSDCDDGNDCTFDDCERPSDPDSVCSISNEPPSKSCGTNTCPLDGCNDEEAAFYNYDETCTLYCDGNGVCESECVCTPSIDDCSDCSCSCGDYNTLETLTNGNTCGDIKDNDCDNLTDLEEEECPDTSMNFTGTLMYSTTNPVSNSLIEVRITNTNLDFEKKVHNMTDEDGRFFVKMQSIPMTVMDSEFDLAIFVSGEVEAIYECHYSTETQKCA